MEYLQINNSCLYMTSNSSDCVNDYTQYIGQIIKALLSNKCLSLNLIIGSEDYTFNNANPVFRININYEHTLVKEGGRGVDADVPTGKIEYNTDKTYCVRICNFQNLNLSDIIIDYSCPNIHNVKSSGLFNDLSNKHIYIAPCIYENVHITDQNRNIYSLTTFINVNEPRRKKLLESIKNSNLHHINVNNCFDKKKVQELYQNTKVLINIHQTDHHDTFEELRCFPALQNGVIVVSEKSPLNHLIPYNDLIIWSDYDNIIDKVKEVLDNYEKYYALVFTEKNINILNNMEMENKTVIEDKIMSLTLEQYAIKYGLDKCIYSGCHNYIPAYTKLFNDIRYDVKNMLEIGIGSLENGQMGGLTGPLASRTNYKTGNSLKCWEEYFPTSNIYGIDIYSHLELNNNRIKTFVADQSSENDLKNLMNKIDAELDIIIDDGSHMGEHQVFSFMHLNKYLSHNGIYVIEDVQPENINGFKDLSIFPEIFKEYIHNNFVVEYFDTRQSVGRPDDFIVSFTRSTI